ncbi:MAG: hypothetical protein PHI59_04170 [Candidatus Omnitrophica bacterium]|nr:hypothetical protein [Candidatus Omnitrophota bacterium]
MASLELMTKKPVVILPFFIVVFLECLALELIFFSTRRPLSFIADPIIRKLYGEAFVHYPYNLIILPKSFYYAQMAIYIFAGVFLTAISVNIFKNMTAGLPVKVKALVQNASKRYLSFAGLGIILIVLVVLLKNVDSYISLRLIRFSSKYIPEIVSRFGYLGFSLLLFFSNLIIQVFTISAVPLMVIWKKPLLKALTGSIVFGFRNFLSVFKLMLLPFMIYLPVVLLKGYADTLAAKTLPEATLYIAIAGSIITAFVDCFIIVCVSRFLLEKNKSAVEK